MEKIKICIIGSAGFIGTNLVKSLRNNKNIILTTFKGDLLKKKDVENFFRENTDINQVIHLVGTFLGDFKKSLEVNVHATNIILEQAVRANIKRIIYASTGAVYGEPLKSISNENDALKPNTIYGLTKIFAEQCLHYYENNFGIKYIILRFPNVYGPGNRKGVIYNFIKSIKDNKKVTIYGTGKQKRNFLFVNDATEAIYKSIYYNGKSETFNVADKKVYSLENIIQILREMNLHFNVEYKTVEKANALQILSEDIKKINNAMGWFPKISVKNGLQEVMKELNLKK